MEQLHLAPSIYLATIVEVVKNVNCWFKYNYEQNGCCLGYCCSLCRLASNHFVHH